MHAAYVVGLLFLLQAAGCATGGRTPATGALQGDTAVAEQSPAAAAAPPPVAAEPVRRDAPPAVSSEPVLPPTVRPAPVAAEPLIAEPPADMAAPSATTARPAGVAKVDRPAAKVPAKVAVPPAPKPETAAPAKPQAPPLALATLEQRLKDTDAIGVFTKITLKNQVDDLLNRVKAHYEGSNKTTLAQLRQTYDQLLLKVHDLLKDGDPALAGAIMNSREAIWTVLTDPVKYAKL